MRVLHVVGARPNFMKAAPVMLALAQHEAVTQCLVHSGQHYDAEMSDVFFRQLDMPAPEVNLEVGSSSHASQTAEIMRRFEPVVMEQKPDLVLVYGDVNSTLAAALVCAKLLVPVGHVEAGLRSFDRTMPEEINRLLADQIADLLFAPSADASENLMREGILPERVYLVGNVMIDTLLRLSVQAEERWPSLQSTLRAGSPGWDAGRYVLVTLHRPSNVDRPETLREVILALNDIAGEAPVVFPLHPRTRRQISGVDDGALAASGAAVQFVEPLGYLDFLALERHATVVITDSGGVQEETTYLGVPCLTVRENTERPVTVSLGTNTLVGHDMDRLRREARELLAGRRKTGRVPPLWDGHAAERIAEAIVDGRPHS